MKGEGVNPYLRMTFIFPTIQILLFFVAGLIKKPSQVQSPQLADLCKEFRLTSDEINKKVSDERILEFHSLLEERGFLPNKWRLVAAHLGFTIADIEAIEHPQRSLIPRFRPFDHQEEKIKSLQMLQKWKNNGTFNKTATYQILLEALIRCECTSSAKRICSK